MGEAKEEATDCDWLIYNYSVLPGTVVDGLLWNGVFWCDQDIPLACVRRDVLEEKLALIAERRRRVAGRAGRSGNGRS